MYKKPSFFCHFSRRSSVVEQLIRNQQVVRSTRIAGSIFQALTLPSTSFFSSFSDHLVTTSSKLFSKEWTTPNNWPLATWVYICVVLISVWPRSAWIKRISAPRSRRCVSKLWRNRCGAKGIRNYRSAPRLASISYCEFQLQRCTSGNGMERVFLYEIRASCFSHFSHVHPERCELPFFAIINVSHRNC